MRLVLLAAAAASALAAQPLEQSARRILDANCGACHGANAMSGLDLRQRETALKGGARGPALQPGNAAASLLFQAVLRNGAVKMPPGKKPLEPAEIDTLRRWIDAGAAWSAPAGTAEPSWWSFRKLAIPTAAHSNPSAEIDRLVDAQLRAKALQPNPRADQRTLIRRLYYDLHGLPAPPPEVERFVNDARPQAWAELVDRLLDSPRYGERWGRHWLDIVRYADTGGFETDIYFPNAWRYRDYVIGSFQKDKPYDRFVKEQIAGDEIWSDNLDLDGGFDIPEPKRQHLAARIGTGMYTIGPAYHEAALFGGQVRYEWLTDVVDTTGEVFLGLTLGCARCHNHKFDPLTQTDYHAMMAVFAASEEREVPVVSQFSIFGYKSGYPNWLKVEELKGAIGRIDRKARARVVEQVRARFPAEVVDAFDKPNDRRTPAERELAARLEKAMTEAGLQENAEGKQADIPYTPEENTERDRLIVELGKAALRANPVPQTATILGAAAVTPDVHITHRGDWRSKGAKVDPAFPVALAGANRIESPQRRRALAEWLTRPDHPLTARVMANRVWHWHFGRGIVATPGDFGRQGEAPVNPELLDFLAANFVADGWSVKKLHRAILLSETYRRSAAHNAANAKLDAGNLFLWRANRQRVDAETLRDSMLAASGALNVKAGGRPVIPPLSKEEYSALWSRNQWPESLDPNEQNRRSVFLYVKRTFPLPMLATFDVPDTSVSCSRRDSTTVAPQALTLINGDFSLRQAQRFAERLRKEHPTDPIGGLWRIALGRDPDPAERSRAQQALNSEDALARLCLVMFNTNEFLYID